jgi:hypothetical protein
MSQATFNVMPTAMQLLADPSTAANFARIVSDLLVRWGDA